jgi:hypothetical protein
MIIAHVFEKLLRNYLARGNLVMKYPIIRGLPMPTDLDIVTVNVHFHIHSIVFTKSS